MIRYTVYFTLLFCVAASVNRYDQWLSLPPVSIHQWRQADGQAIAWHYARDPGIAQVLQFNLFEKGDAHAVGELPVLYWMSGQITRYIGFPEFPLRWIGLVLLFAGCWAFGWMILQFTQRPFFAALGAGLLLSAPVLAYYGPGFLPDVPAFCWILLMSACLLKANQQQKMCWIWIAGLCASLAIMLKISMIIVPLALGLTKATGQWQRRWPTNSIWSQKGFYGVVLSLILAVGACRWWIFQYNTTHHAKYFFSEIRPFWWYDWTALGGIMKGICAFGLPAYASAGLYLACLGSLVLWFKNRNSMGFFWRKTLLFIALGCLTFVALWFRMLREHDYYAICLLVLPAALILMGFRIGVERYSNQKIVLVLTVCWMLGLAHSHYLLGRRLQEAFAPLSTRNLPPEAFLSDNALSQAGIPASARFICPEDPSPNIALMALKRNGWTAYNFGDRITAERLQEYAAGFGLSHLALRDTSDYKPLYQQFFPVSVLNIKGWYIYQH